MMSCKDGLIAMSFKDGLKTMSCNDRSCKDGLVDYGNIILDKNRISDISICLPHIIVILRLN